MMRQVRPLSVSAKLPDGNLIAILKDASPNVPYTSTTRYTMSRLSCTKVSGGSEYGCLTLSFSWRGPCATGGAYYLNFQCRGGTVRRSESYVSSKHHDLT